MENIKECFIKISNEYINERKKNFSKNSLGEHIRNKTPEIIKNKINLDTNKYMFNEHISYSTTDEGVEKVIEFLKAHGFEE